MALSLFQKYQLGLVCFRLIGSDKLNEKLLSTINESGKLHMVPACVNERYIIRFCAVAQHATVEDIDYAWDVIVDFATELLEKEQQDEITEISQPKKEDTLAKKRSFFVRMVSDPKIYNPAINKAGTPKLSLDMLSPVLHSNQFFSATNPEIRTSDAENCQPINLQQQQQQQQQHSSWISWPLAFLFNSNNNSLNSGNNNEDNGGQKMNNVSLR